MRSYKNEKEGKDMEEFMIKLDSIDEVKEFVALTNKCAFDVDLMSGRYAIDAKSIMGIMAFNPSDGMTVDIVTKGDDEMEALDAIEKFLVCE